MPRAEDALRLYRILLSPDAVETGTPTSSSSAAGKPDGAVEILLRENAGLKKKVDDVESDNAKYRRNIKALKEELATARDSESVPTEVAAELDSYRKLGKPGDIGTRLDEAAKLGREKALNEIGEKAGVTNLKAFLRLAGDTEFEVRDDAKSGEKGVFVKDGDEQVPFDEHFAEFLPSIKPDAQRGETIPTGFGTPRRSHAATPEANPNRPDGNAGEPPQTPKQQLLGSGRYVGVPRR